MKAIEQVATAKDRSPLPLAGDMPQTSQRNDPRSRGLKGLIVEEAHAFFWIFLYLLLLFGFFALSEAVLLHKSGVEATATGFAVVNAAVFGKVVLVGEKLGYGRWLRHSPLAWQIALQSFSYTMLLIGFHFAERAIVGLVRHGSASAEPAGLGGGGWLGFLLVATLVFVGLLPFFAYRSLARELGADKLRAMLFDPPPH